jgi:hypothetical protein
MASRTRVSSSAADVRTSSRDANVSLLDMIGTPVILPTHSGGETGWLVADGQTWSRRL